MQIAQDRSADRAADALFRGQPILDLVATCEIPAFGDEIRAFGNLQPMDRLMIGGGAG